MGEVFAGRYELADPIGRGGVGAVWRAWDHRRRRYVAAKVLQQRDAHSLLRFVREQGLRIDHPHVLAPASWAADDDKVLFTMDLVAGGSLVHLIGDYGPLPPAFVCALLDQLLSGLAAVHAEGVVHRDIKPANVLLEATGTGRPRLRLSDFGIAMRLGEPRLTETNLVVGTPGYLAPEQLLGAEPDFTADLFAVGLVALYLLEGARPDAKALVQHFLEHGTPGPPKGIPEPLWQVVASLLQPDPADRFRTATGARKALAGAADLLPEPGPDDELIEVFDQLGPLPPGFGPDGPLQQASGVTLDLISGPTSATTLRRAPEEGERAQGEADAGAGTGSGTSAGSGAGAGTSAGMSMGAGTSAGTSSGPAPGAGAAPSHPAGGATAAGTAPGAGMAAGTAPGAGTDFGAGTDPGAGTAAGTDSRGGTGPGAPPSTDSLSDTGSFRLPPPWHPAAPDPTPPPPPVFGPGPVPHQPSFRTPIPAHLLGPSTDTATTAAYTAREPQVAPHTPPQFAPPPSSTASTAPTRRAPGARGRRARRAPRRPGPPARAAIPLLLLALACYAVGFWALTRL
ncbi:serine/threonine-protein kinase [Streptomyces sp. NPDC014636]|uniref:serine/threonine-protein kinase n=1 Tax=Streptomyces sp. NPDC014636 TaxID=3364876 RepID=UPI0036F7DA37